MARETFSMNLYIKISPSMHEHSLLGLRAGGDGYLGTRSMGDQG